MQNQQNSGNNIRVVCRLRPLNKLEQEMGGRCCVKYTETAIQVAIEEEKYDFTFDRIFGPETRQVDVFNYVALPVIDSVMDGFNGTIFAYGQTGSGKSFSMEGPSIDDEELKGIIPRMMSHVFQKIINASETIEFSVKVSFLEIYNEKIQDLLDARKSNLQIKEDKTKGIHVQDATEVYVSSAEQMIQVMKTGSMNRSVAATRMNENSSRSHSIFILQVTQKDTKTDTTKTGKLYFIDLAGSEKVAKTNVSGQQLEEAKNINKSLTCLGKVINALTEKEKGYVPYRESKLTRMLQESLGGNSKTTLLLAGSMCSYNDKETLSTLRFGNRAKAIKNCAIANVERSAKELQIMLNAAEKKLKEQEEIINSLQAQLDGGVTTPRNTSQVESSAEKKEAEEVKAPEANVQVKQLKAEPSTPTASTSQANATEQVVAERKQTRSETQAPERSAGHGSTSLTLLKQHIQITNLNEEIQELKVANKDLENDIATKTQEIYDLNDKLIRMQAELNDMSDHQLRLTQEFQVNFEKICHENQTKTHLFNKLRRELSRLRSDLNFLLINRNIAATLHQYSQKSHKKEDDHDEITDDYIVNSIQKALMNIEDIEREFEASPAGSSIQQEIEIMLQNFGKSHKSASKLSDQPRESRRSRLPINEHLSTAADEEIKLSVNSEESAGKRDTETLKTEEDIIIDEETFNRLMDSSDSNNHNVKELQTLLINQRKTISYLSKLNEELSSTNNSDVSQFNQKILKYKKKISDLKKLALERGKENDEKVNALKSMLEEKIQEIKELKHNAEREGLQYMQQINDLKYQRDKLQQTIMGNNTTKRIHELEQKIRDHGLERQKLFEDLFKLRQEVDEKDDLVSEKSTQIQILQNNLNTLSNQLESLTRLKNSTEKVANPMRNATNVPKPNPINSKNEPVSKNDLVFFDKHIINPIKGGGGNIENFERNNPMAARRPKLDDSSFKKFDEMLRNTPKGKKTISNLTFTHDPEEEEQSIVKFKLSKLKADTSKNTVRGLIGNIFG